MITITISFGLPEYACGFARGAKKMAGTNTRQTESRRVSDLGHGIMERFYLPEIKVLRLHCAKQRRPALRPPRRIQLNRNYAVTGSFAFTFTGVSQPKRSGFSPFAMAKNSSAIFCVVSPGLPSPITMRSIDRIGDTSAAVPVKKTSS